MTSADATVGAPSQLSDAVAVPVNPGKVLSVHRIVILAGHVMVGGVLSSTKMVCKQLLELPQASVAVHVLLIVYSCGQAPPTVTSLEVIFGVGSQSVAVADPVLSGSELAVHSMVILAGQVITGARLSSISII